MELHRFCTATQLKVTRTLGWPTSPILILETIWYNPLAFTKYFFKICWLKAVFVLKMAFIQKGLMRLSFLQTDKSNYFPELEFWYIFFHSKWLKSCQINKNLKLYSFIWSCSDVFFWAFRAASCPYLTWFDPFGMKKKINKKKIIIKL